LFFNCNFLKINRYTDITKQKEIMETPTLLKSEIRVIAIDETRFWKQHLQDTCGKIETVYMYDSSVTTNLCEITPSYELTPLYYVIENDVDDEIRDKVDENISDEEPIYMHCNVVDELESISSENGFDFESSESDEYKEEFESARDYLNGNHLM